MQPSSLPAALSNFWPARLEVPKRSLPCRMHLKNNSYYYVHKNKWTYISGSKPIALRRYIEEFADSEELRREAAILANTPDEGRRYLARVYHRARKNAAKREIDFNLTPVEYADIVKRSRGRCEVSGLPFDLQFRKHARRRPFAPSLDRTNSRRAYTAENCRLVCCIVNTAMSDWGEQPFILVALALAEKHSGSSILQRHENTYPISWPRKRRPRKPVAEETASA